MARALAFWTVTLAVIALAPVIVLVGEPVRRYYMRQLKRRPLQPRLAGVNGVARAVLTNPVLIALTAPGRWVIGQVGHLRFRRTGRPRLAAACGGA